jgi:hypothetical protein
MEPIWNVDAQCRDKIISVDNIISLDTAGLNGKKFDWQDYGGPLALLRLSEFVRIKILGDSGKFGSHREAESIVPPSLEHQQQGQLILKRID